MVLKALFVGASLAPIAGLDWRTNPDLARMLRDYAHERWAAGRSFNPELWRCVGPQVSDDEALADVVRALADNDPDQQRAAALALTVAPHADAGTHLAQRPDLRAAIERGELVGRHWSVFRTELEPTYAIHRPAHSHVVTDHR